MSPRPAIGVTSPMRMLLKHAHYALTAAKPTEAQAAQCMADLVSDLNGMLSQEYEARDPHLGDPLPDGTQVLTVRIMDLGTPRIATTLRWPMP